MAAKRTVLVLHGSVPTTYQGKTERLATDTRRMEAYSANELVFQCTGYLQQRLTSTVAWSAAQRVRKGHRLW